MDKIKKIAIHGVPRSGTTWIGEIINSSKNVKYAFQPLFSYKYKNYLTKCSNRYEINNFFELLKNELEDSFILQKDKRENGLLPKFIKSEITHVVYKEVRYHNILFNLARNSPDLKFVFIIRSPFAVINSWLKAPREFRKDLNWSIYEEWRYALKKNLNKVEEFNGFEKWKEATNIFLEIKKQFPDRVYIIEYNKFLENTLKYTTELFSFCELKLESQTMDFISKRSRREEKDAYSVYRIKNNDDKWKYELDNKIVKEIKSDLFGTSLKKYMYLS